jgi:hypothetical protein
MTHSSVWIIPPWIPISAIMVVIAVTIAAVGGVISTISQRKKVR